MLTGQLPKQKEDLLDCGVYVGAFAEYVNEKRQIPFESPLMLSIIERDLGHYCGSM